MNGAAIQNLEAGAAKQPRPKLHEIKPPKPQAGGQGVTLIVAAFGALFLAYVFNFRGFETSIDTYFNGLNAAMQSHSPEVTHGYLRLLPYACLLLLAAFLWMIAKTMFRMVAGIFKPKKAKAKQVAAEPAVSVSAKKAEAKAPAVCVKPMRLDQRDRGVTRVILTRR